MSQLAQLGVFTGTVGSVTMIIGLFPGAVNIDRSPGIGLAQIIAILMGLTLLTAGAYVFVYATWHRGEENSLSQDVGIRMGLTGLTVAYVAGLADVLGFGSHTVSAGLDFGRFQTTGMALGFLLAALGVLVYGTRP